MMRPDAIRSDSCKVRTNLSLVISEVFDTSDIAIMKVLAFVAIATFLFVGTKSDSPTEATREVWSRECRQETGYELPAPGTKLAAHLQTAEARRYAECYATRAGFMQNGALLERGKACDIIVREMENYGKVQLQEGRTTRQLAEKCYDDAKVKTDKYEIAGTLMICVVEGTVLQEV